MRCVFVAGIHPSRTCMSGSFESVRWNACVHRLDLSFSFIRQSFGGMESEPMLTPREKSPLQEKFSAREDRTHDVASSRTASPTHYQGAIPAPVVSSRQHRPQGSVISGKRDQIGLNSASTGASETCPPPPNSHPFSRRPSAPLTFLLPMSSCCLTIFPLFSSLKNLINQPHSQHRNSKRH